MSERICCDQCRFWSDPRPGEESWYQIGRCTASNTLHPNPPGWGSCHLAKRRHGAKAAKDGAHE